jgi:hypothetical protein
MGGFLRGGGGGILGGINPKRELSIVDELLSARGTLPPELFREIQKRMNLNNSEMGQFLQVSVKSIESYRNGSRKVPCHTGWVLRIIMILNRVRYGKMFRSLSIRLQEYENRQKRSKK